jgi:hypothetical protein
MVFGASMRPKRCDYFDEYKCNMKPVFQTRIASWIKVVDTVGFAKVEKLVRYDRNGVITAWPTFERLRSEVGMEAVPV